MTKEKEIKQSVEESKRITTALKKSVKGLKSVNTNGVILENAPPKKNVDMSGASPSDVPV